MKQRFGAHRVIPFGSLVDEGPWHESSDLDLAVEGLSLEALWSAERELERIVPSWLEVDLLPLERAYPEVRARILGERPTPENPYLALKARLEDELVGLERITGGGESGRPPLFGGSLLLELDEYRGILEHMLKTLRYPHV